MFSLAPANLNFKSIILILQEGQAAASAADESNSLGQASLKYLDALATDPSNYMANLEVGRMCLMQEDYTEAIIRLQQALGLKPSSMISRSSSLLLFSDCLMCICCLYAALL